MRERLKLTILIAATSMVGAPLAGQSTDPITAGSEIRLFTQALPQGLRGPLRELRNDTLLVFARGLGDTTVPLDHLLRLQIHKARRSRVTKGAIIGGLLAGVYGGVVAHQLTNEDTSQIVKSSMLGTLTGAGLGALVGLVTGPDHWQSLSPEVLRGRSIPRGPGSFRP